MPFRRREEDPRPPRPGGSRFRRDQPEEEPEEVERPFGMRREPPAGGGSSPWRREWEPGPGPRAEPIRRRGPTLTELLVPASEREDPYFEYSKVFDRPARQRTIGPAQAPRGEGGAPPFARRGAPEAAAAAPQTRRPGRAREGPPQVDPKNWFDEQKIFDAARRVRSDSRFKPGSPVALVQIAPARSMQDAQKAGARNQQEAAAALEALRAEDLVRFFRIPKEEVERHANLAALWSGTIAPFLDELSYAFNAAKPQDLPGQFGFQPGRDGSFWLAYME